jgi:hypothetical protein
MKVPSSIFRAGVTPLSNTAVTFGCVEETDAEMWLDGLGPNAKIFQIDHTCTHPAGPDEVRAAAADLGLGATDYARASYFDSDPDYSPFDWLYDARVRAELESRGYDCGMGPDFMQNMDVDVVALWVPGTFRAAHTPTSEGVALLRAYVTLLMG